MDYKYIPMDTYARKDHFAYFKQMGYPYVGITVNVEITEWLSAVKAYKLPFFHSFLYAVAAAANQIPQFRQRIKEDALIEYDYCLSSYTVALEDETYCYCTLDTQKPFEQFLAYAAKEQEKAAAQAAIDDGEDAGALFFISSLPWLSYSNIIQPVPVPADSNPRITWGRYFQMEQKMWIPVSLLCHHAIVDGVHLHHFYEQLTQELCRLCSQIKWAAAEAVERDNSKAAANKEG